jgi:cell pole-organizing protein PopZ
MTMHQPGEPSVEEILDSIKKVIARDNRAGAMATRRERARTPTNDTRTEPAPAQAEAAEEVLELDEEAMVAQGSETADAEAGPVGSAGYEEDEAPLTTETVRATMQQNFEALAMISRPGKQPQIVRSGETSLEALTRELLRPMLAQWLDENLPEMVEELVKAEIARIAGKRD